VLSIHVEQHHQYEQHKLTPVCFLAVSIAEPEALPPVAADTGKDTDEMAPERTSPKQHRVKLGTRISSRASLTASPRQSPLSMPFEEEADDGGMHHHHRFHGHHGSSEGLVAQVSAWLKQEKARRAARKSKDREREESATGSEDASFFVGAASAQMDGSAMSAPRRPSDKSEDSIALDNLQDILHKHLSLSNTEKPPSRQNSNFPRRISSIRKLRRQSTAGSSDTDYHDGEPLVPSCDAILDNSKTLSYSGGTPDAEQGTATPGRNTPKEKEAWATFKFEIVRLSHTLRLKGWRRVPMEQSGDIDVERLSGALTNAVYVVSPPRELPSHPHGTSKSESSSALVPKKPPP